MGGAIQKVSKDSFFLYHTHVESTVEGIKKLKIVVLPIVSSIFLEGVGADCFNRRCVVAISQS